MPACDEPGLDRPRLGVVACMQDRGVGLARSGTDVLAGLDQRDSQLEASQLAGDRRPDVPRADDREVVVEVAAQTGNGLLDACQGRER